MFTEALFIIAKIWKQPKCPPIGEWIKKMVCVCVYVCECDGILLSQEKESNLAICVNMVDLKSIMLSQTKKTNIV